MRWPQTSLAIGLAACMAVLDSGAFSALAMDAHAGAPASEHGNDAVRSVVLPSEAAAPVVADRNSPAMLMRALARLQEQIARGDKAAFQRQASVIADIASTLRAADAALWQQPRNRMALIGFVVRGGPPDILRSIAEQGVFQEPEVALAEGVLAYAEGHFAEARVILDGIDAPALEPALSGAVALVKAVLHARDDRASVLALCDAAILASPGTLSEEAALRIAIEVSANGSDAAKFRSYALRYLRRFSRSPFLSVAMPRIAAFIAAGDRLSDSNEAAALTEITGRLDETQRSQLFSEVARAALWLGKPETALVAARLARAGAIGDAVKASLTNYEGAALIALGRVDEGRAMLDGLGAEQLGGVDQRLRTAAGIVAGLVHAPVEFSAIDQAGAPPAEDKHPVVARGERSVQRAQELLAEGRS